jgi:hypothetical protein
MHTAYDAQPAPDIPGDAPPDDSITFPIGLQVA